jgi:DHA3 family macrolide efflux protein-like MFS transporter
MWQFISNKHNRSFFRFWMSQLTSQFGDRVHQMALVGLIAARAPGSPLELAKLLSFTIIPVFLVGPIAGVYVDRWSRRWTLFVCDILRGALVLLMAFYLMDMRSIVPIYAAVFLIFSFSRFYVPAKMSYIPQLVGEKDLHIANSFITVTGMIALVLGALLGGLIVEYAGPRGGFIWDATTFFISALLIVTISRRFEVGYEREKKRHSARAIVHAHKTLLSEIQEGIGYISSQKDIRFIFFMMSILFAAAGAIYVVIIVFVQQAFGSVTKDLGFLAVPLGVGLFLGSMAYAKWGGKFSKFQVIFGALILGGLLIAIFAGMVHNTHNRLLAMALSFVLGFVSGPIMIAANTVVHQVCNAQMSGKVFAALEFVMHLAFLVAMFVSSILAEQIERVWILIAVGVIFMGVGVIGFFKHRES